MRLEPAYSRNSRRVKCPAEENVNCEKSPPINARKNCGKTDIRANRLIHNSLKIFNTALIQRRSKK